MEGLTALITGGSAGIGLCTARMLVERGVRVVIVGRDSDKLRRAAESMGDRADSCKTIAGDVSTEGYVNKIVRDALNELGHLDILINSAGVFRNIDLLEMTEEDFDYNIGVNLKGTWFMCRAVARSMIGNGGGVIVNVSSLLAKLALPGVPSSAYSASKGGVLSLTAALAVELAPFKIRVNAVLPALVKTAMMNAVAGGLSTDELAERAGKKYPLGRIGEPEDVARGIVFLADPQNGWITGAELVIDGGISIT